MLVPLPSPIPPIQQQERRRITFAPGSSAVHKAPVTIYPSKEQTSKRFSLVLSGKGTVGRGAGLDIGNASKESLNGNGDKIGPNASRESLERKKRRFEGLEKGLAVGRLSRLLGRVRSPPPSPAL